MCGGDALSGLIKVVEVPFLVRLEPEQVGTMYDPRKLTRPVIPNACQC